MPQKKNEPLNFEDWEGSEGFLFGDPREQEAK